MRDLESQKPEIEESDGPPDELDPIDVVEGELERLFRHPRQEGARLKAVANDGEHGTAPAIQMALVARWVYPIVLIMVGIALVVYFKA